MWRETLKQPSLGRALSSAAVIEASALIGVVGMGISDHTLMQHLVVLLVVFALACITRVGEHRAKLRSSVSMGSHGRVQNAQLSGPGPLAAGSGNGCESRV